MSLQTIRKKRSHKIFIDSRNMIEHENNNPSTYIYPLPESIPNVTEIRLLSHRLPYSPTFVVIRSSKWFDPGVTTAQTDDVHQKAVELANISRTIDPEKSSRVATLYKDDSSVSLNVIEVFTFTKSRENGDFRTYDIWVATGTMATSSRVGWKVQDPSDPTASSDLVMVGSASDTADAADYADSDAGESSIAINVINENMYLDIDVGQGEGRIKAARTVYPRWKSFQVYRKGDFACYGETCYTCLKNHMSLIFSEDVDTYWKSIDNIRTDTAPANGSFYVVETEEPNETAILESFSPRDVVMELPSVTVRELEITWKTHRGSRFIFPHSTAIDFLSFSSSETVATFKKEYRHHTLLLELSYEEETEVFVPDGQQPTANASSTGGFLLPARAPLLGTTRPQ